MTTTGLVFFFNDTATTEIYTLSLHDALPIYVPRPGRWHHLGAVDRVPGGHHPGAALPAVRQAGEVPAGNAGRSEEHTSELQSRQYLVCRLLLEKKKKSLTAHCVFNTHTC